MNREIFIRVFDQLKGTKIYSYYNFYKKTLHWDREQIENYQLQKLKSLIHHAYYNIPFYTERFKSIGLEPPDIKSFEDLKQIPLLTRQDLQENSKNLVDKSKDVSKLIKGGSSGTTGTPIQFFHDHDAESAGIASGWSCWSMSGWEFGNKQVHMWGNFDSIRKWNRPISKLKRYFYNQTNIASTFLNKDDQIQGVVDQISSYRPDYIDGYANALFILAQYIKDHEIDFPKCKLILTTAENLHEHQKMVIEDVLGPVSDIYGCSEINGIASKPAGSDRYYIFEPHLYAEAQQVSNCSTKEIILTDLENRTMPFIRYQVGDLIDDIYPGADNDQFKFRYIKSLNGRTADIIDLGNGQLFIPVNIFGGALSGSSRRLAGTKLFGMVKNCYLYSKQRTKLINILSNKK